MRRDGAHGASAPPPAPLRRAIWFLGAYAILVLLNATALQVASDWVGAADYPRAWVRALGVAVLGVALWRRHRLAWWIAVALVSFWLATALVGLAGLAVGHSVAPRDVLPFEPWFVSFALAVTVLLGGALHALLRPATRAALRQVVDADD